MSAFRQVVRTAKAPAPIPVLSQALIHGGLVYCSGQIGADPKTGKLVEGDITERAKQVFENLSSVLEAAGTTLENVIKVNVFLDDIDNFAKINEIYGQYFITDPKPVRTCVAVKELPLKTDIEIELTASLPQ